jgi:hypothetical protein
MISRIHMKFSGIATRWRSSSPTRRACFLGCCSAAVFVLVNWHNYVTDYTPLALIPVSVWRAGTTNLDLYRHYYESLPATARYAFIDSQGHLFAMKPIFVSLLALPWYLPPVLSGVPTEAVDFWIAWGRLAAAILTGISVSLSYIAIQRWTDETGAVALTLMMAFGTGVWTTVGQTLTYHAGAILCVSALVLALKDFPLTWGRASWVGFLTGATVGMRPTAVILVLPLVVFMCRTAVLPCWKTRLSGFAGIIVVPLLNALMNAHAFGHWYATGYAPGEIDRWTTPVAEGALGLLVAPNSGLFMQSPFMILAVVGGWVAWRTKSLPGRGLLCAFSSCFVVYLLLFARWHDWQGGLTFATRMLSEGYPLLLPLTAVGWNRLRHEPWATRMFVISAVWSVLYQIIGIATFDRVSLDNPPHLPWQPMHHFFLLYALRFGIWTTLLAVTITIAQLCVCIGSAVYVLAPFFLTPPQACSVHGSKLSTIS